MTIGSTMGAEMGALTGALTGAATGADIGLVAAPSPADPPSLEPPPDDPPPPEDPPPLEPPPDDPPPDDPPPDELPPPVYASKERAYTSLFGEPRTPVMTSVVEAEVSAATTCAGVADVLSPRYTAAAPAT